MQNSAYVVDYFDFDSRCDFDFGFVGDFVVPTCGGVADGVGPLGVDVVVGLVVVVAPLSPLGQLDRQQATHLAFLVPS